MKISITYCKRCNLQWDGAGDGENNICAKCKSGRYLTSCIFEYDFDVSMFNLDILKGLGFKRHNEFTYKKRLQNKDGSRFLFINILDGRVDLVIELSGQSDGKYFLRYVENDMDVKKLTEAIH